MDAPKAPSHRIQTSTIPNRLMRQALDLPGRLSTFFAPSPRSLDLTPVPPQSLEAHIIQSPRANTYLSLEPGLHYTIWQGAPLTYATLAQHLFIVGGIHGPRTDAAERLRAFIQHASKAGYRRILLFPIAPEEIAIAEAAGIACIPVGAEAFLDPTTFSLAGKARRDLRQMTNRATKRHQLHVQPLDPIDDHDAILSTYLAWLAHHKNGVMRLLVGSPCLDTPAQRRYFGAFSPAYTDPLAIATITPGWSKQGWGLDVMARKPHAPSGTMDLLLTHILQQLADEACQRFSLGACPMAYIDPKDPHLPAYLTHIFRFLYSSSLGNQLFNFRSLAYFKNKFDPCWKPVYIGGWPNINPWSLYIGCRMWGLFSSPASYPPSTSPPLLHPQK